MSHFLGFAFDFSSSLGELLTLLGFFTLLRGMLLALALCGSLLGTVLSVSVGCTHGTLDHSSGSLRANLLNQLLFDEDGGELDGSFSSHCSLSGSNFSRLVTGNRFFSDLLCDLSSNSLQLLDSFCFVVFGFDNNLVDSDDGFALSGVFDLSRDVSSGTFADLQNELVVHFLEGLLDHFLGLLSDLLSSFM